MKKLAVLLLMATGLAVAAEPARKPKLVLTIVVDQFRYDYLTRYKSDYKVGLSRLLTQGAVFTDAHFQHFPTVTAIGHSVILTGAMPSVSGIVGFGGSGGTGSSPHRSLASTVGDLHSLYLHLI